MPTLNHANSLANTQECSVTMCCKWTRVATLLLSSCFCLRSRFSFSAWENFGEIINKFLTISS